MKAVFIGNDEKVVEVASLSMRLRWPDVELQKASTAAEGLELIEKTSPDVVLLHPDFTDLSLSQAIQGIRRFPNILLLVLGRTKEKVEVITSLEAGADDHVFFPPCTPPELTMRISGLLRRASLQQYSGSEGPLQSGALLISPSAYEAFFNKERLHLTSTEFRLLYMLARNRGTVVKHETLEQTIWSAEIKDAKLVKKYIQGMRRKLGDDARMPRWIASVHGVGYRFIGPPSQAAERATV